MVRIFERKLSNGTINYVAQVWIDKCRMSKIFNSPKEARKWAEEAENNLSIAKTEPPEKNNYNRLLNLSERNQIEKYLAKDYPMNAIARLIGRSKNGVRVEVRMNGGIKCYNATQAHERAMNTKKVKHEILSKINAKRCFNPWNGVKKRIEILEMQLEIVLDYIQNQKKENKT